jgi:hypothetical protein
MTSGYLRGSNNLLAGASAQGGFTIEESLRFNASQSSYLSRTFGTGNRKTYTLSFWIKRGALGRMNFFNPGDNATFGGLSITANNTIEINNRVGGTNAVLETAQLFRDPSAWYHLVWNVDTTQATASNRSKLYVNGAQVTAFSTEQYPAQNADTNINSAVVHWIGRFWESGFEFPFDGYLTEVNFIDGQALTPSSFGQFDGVTGVWKPAKYTGTYGTNGFYLPMQLDNTVEGFNTVTYLGTSPVSQRISGVGFSPDLVWIKSRGQTYGHVLVDTVRGVGKDLASNTTGAESSSSTELLSFDTDGFTVGAGGSANDPTSPLGFVAWCWDAGDTTVSNTDGSITSSVRASTDYGFSIVTWTGSGVAGATVGHELGVAPSMVIVKQRTDSGTYWNSYHISIGNGSAIDLNTTSAAIASSFYWNNTSPTSSVFSISTNGTGYTNVSGKNYVAYCFSEVAGYSKFGSYAGTGATGNAVTTGFKPAMVMLKRSTGVEYWQLFDNTRSVGPEIQKVLYPNGTDSEYTWGSAPIKFTDTGFELLNSDVAMNGGSDTYIYMAFADTREYAYWLDDSGNNNDWQPNGGITTESTVTDTPTPYADGGNYAVLNPLDKNSNLTLSNGNLDFVPANTSDLYSGRSTFQIPSTGKWIWQVTNTNSAYMITAGLIDGATPLLGQQTVSCASMTVGSIGTFFSTTQWMNTTTSWSVTNVGNGDTLVIAYDADAGKIWFGRVASNGSTVSWYNTSGTADPSTGTDPRASGITAGNWFAGVGAYYTPSGASINYGQRPFAFTNAPSGFLPLHTGNLPDSAIVDGSKYFNATTYTGNGSSQSIVNSGAMQPDLVWVKNRSTISNHDLVDSVRGATKVIESDLTAAEFTEAGNVNAFNSNGFTVGSVARVNGNGNSLVAWQWKANGAGVSNTDGSITSTVSANPTAGFSIVTWSGNATSGATIGHGLGSAPKMIIAKVRNSGGTYNWYVYHESLGSTSVIYLDLTLARDTGSTIWGSTTPTSSVFSVGSNTGINGSGLNFVAYCFAEVPSFSKMGSYVGNGSTDGPFVYTGFRPAFVLMKASSAVEQWSMWDSSRLGYNPYQAFLAAQSSSAEDATPSGANSNGGPDFLSNGFKMRSNGGSSNTNGATYIYMAFAENPFKNSLAR